MNTFAVLGAALVVAGAAAAYLVWDQFASPQCEGEPIESLPAGTPGAYHLGLTLHNSVDQEPTRSCLFDEPGSKVFDQTYRVSGDEGVYWEVYVPSPPSSWIVDRPGGRGADLDGIQLYAKECQGVVPEFFFSKYEHDGWVVSVDCAGQHPPADFPRRPGDASEIQAFGGPAPDFGMSPPGAAVAAGLSLSAALLAIFKFRQALTWAFLGLFSRISAPRVLDSNVRTQIHQLVTTEPGIGRFEIAERLELGAGQTVHHLRVLLREHVLSEVGRGLRKHYFLKGTFPPDRMRQMALLRSTSYAAFVRAVQDQPGSPLSLVAVRAGLSRPRASQVLRRCQALGLVRAERAGKNVLLFPTAPPNN